MKTKRPLLLLALVSLLPNLRAALPGLTYYFRDFSLTYYPLRAFFASELAEGRWPFWNPYVHEGSALLPMLYPLELIQALWPGPAFVSWLLTLHFPIAALAMYALARELGAERRGAFGAGAAYSMGGLALSCLSLHWFLQALALAPLVALATRRAALRGGRWVALAAILIALSISTLAVEFAAQGLLLGVALSLVACAEGRASVRLLGAGFLGAALASLPIALTLGIVSESLRGAGLGPAQLLDRALPATALLQTLVPDLVGSIAEPQRFWWGGRLFSGGPYFMSLYLGPAVLGLAALGFVELPRRLRWALGALALLGLWYALGSALGLASIVAPALRFFRFPVKALLLPHFALAVAFGFGVDRLAAGKSVRALTTTAVSLGLLALGIAGLGYAGSRSLAQWLEISPAAQSFMSATLAREGLQAALVSLAVGGLALATSGAWLPPPRAALLALALAVADLGRAGLGVNPQTPVDFFELTPGVQSALAGLAGGRLFSFGVDQSPALAAWSASRPPGLDRQSFLLGRQVLNPFSNVADRIEVAEGHDRLSFIPNPPTLQAGEYDPSQVDSIAPRLRNEAVSRIVSLDPLASPQLRLRARVPVGPDEMSIHVYDLADPWPRAYVACRVLPTADRLEALRRPLAPDFDPARDVALELPAEASCRAGRVERREFVPGKESYLVDLDRPGLLVMRDSHAPGWQARVDGEPARVLRANGRQRAVPLRAGRHVVDLRYEPPGLRAGLVGTLLAALVTGLIAFRRPGGVA